MITCGSCIGVVKNITKYKATFVETDEGTVFVSAPVVKNAGLAGWLKAGDEVVVACTKGIEKNGKYPEATSISLTSNGPQPSENSPRCEVGKADKKSLDALPKKYGPGEAVVGRVKSFNAKKGFGFLTVEGRPDLFFHITQFAELTGFKDVRLGDELNAVVGKGLDGRPAAVLIRFVYEGKVETS